MKVVITEVLSDALNTILGHHICVVILLMSIKINFFIDVGKIITHSATHSCQGKKERNESFKLKK